MVEKEDEIEESDKNDDSIENLVEDMNEMEFIQSFMEFFYKDQWNEFIKFLKEKKRQKIVNEEIEILAQEKEDESKEKRLFLFNKDSILKLKEFHDLFFKKRNNQYKFLVYLYDFQIKSFNRSEIEFVDNYEISILAPDECLLITKKDNFGFYVGKLKTFNFKFLNLLFKIKSLKAYNIKFPLEIKINKEDKDKLKNETFYLAIDKNKIFYHVRILKNKNE